LAGALALFPVQNNQFFFKKLIRQARAKNSPELCDLRAGNKARVGTFFMAGQQPSALTSIGGSCCCKLSSLVPAVLASRDVQTMSPRAPLDKTATSSITNDTLQHSQRVNPCKMKPSNPCKTASSAPAAAQRSAVVPPHKLVGSHCIAHVSHRYAAIRTAHSQPLHVV